MVSKSISVKGILIIISSPSGAGKTSISKRILERDSRITFSISATTRKPRHGEKNGREYFFKTKEEFNQMISSGEMLEYAEVFGNIYGTPKEPVENALSSGKDVLFDVDWQGGLNIKDSYLREFVVSIFILPPSIKELHNRLIKRGQDSPEVVRSRMQKSKEEISHWSDYDYVLINEKVEQIHEDIATIIRAERLKRFRRESLHNYVNLLNSEFEESYQ